MVAEFKKKNQWNGRRLRTRKCPRKQNKKIQRNENRKGKKKSQKSEAPRGPTYNQKQFQ